MQNLKDLSVPELNDLYIQISHQITPLFRGYTELTEDSIPQETLDKANGFYKQLDEIYLELKSRKP